MAKEKRDITNLNNLFNEEGFKDIFGKLCLNKELENSEKEFILASAILFFRFYELNKRNKVYFKIGYYIILKYALKYKDYRPLYDVSLQIGFYPIVEFITATNKLLRVEEGSKNLILDALTFFSYRKDFTSNEGFIESLEQNSSRKSIIKSTKNEIAYIAPTSYGKSSLIIEFIKQNKPQRIGVIVPTKSLLVQTYNDIKKSNQDYKVVLHDEMYRDDKKFIGILTQERATRILNNNKNIFFDVIFIDEAHNMLKRDARSYILSRLIQLNYSRNNNQKVIFLSPMIENEDSLKVKKSKDGNIYTKKVKHDFKSFELYYFNENKSYFFDRFTGGILNLEIDKKYFEYIADNSLSKNFIYHNKPMITEELALELSKNLNVDLSKNPFIDNILSTLKKEVHSSFHLISCVKKGVVYIHGKIPNIIKEYIEAKFKEIPELTYIVANKVILEGINLPIETIFIANNKIGRKNIGLNDLLNLIGRANRLNYVFSTKNKKLDSLISKIHFLNHPYYQGAYSIISSLSILNKNKLKDVIENPILENYNIDELTFSDATEEKRKEKKEKHQKEDENLINYSEFVLNSPKDEIDRMKKYFIENSIEKYFDNLDKAVKVVLDNISNYKFDAEHKIIDIIYEILLNNNLENITDFELDRLKNKSARNYYNFFIEVTQKRHLNHRINATIKHFNNKIKLGDPYLYIGSGYGEKTSTEAGKPSRYDEENPNKKWESKVYVDLENTKQDHVNLAIVKLKIEEDFISYQLTLLIAFLYDFGVIPKDYYYYYIYGTTDEKMINLARFGLNISIVTKLQEDNQADNLILDDNGNLSIKNKTEFQKYLELQPVLFQFEIQKYLSEI